MDGHDMRMDTVEYLLKVPKVEVITPHEIMTDKAPRINDSGAFALGTRVPSNACKCWKLFLK